MSIIPVRQNSSFLSDSVKKSNHRVSQDIESVISSVELYIVELSGMLKEAGLKEDEVKKKTGPFEKMLNELREIKNPGRKPDSDIRSGIQTATERNSSVPIINGMFNHSSNDKYRKWMMGVHMYHGTIEKALKMIEDSKKDLNGKRNLFSGKLELKNQVVVDRMRKITSAK